MTGDGVSEEEAMSRKLARFAPEILGASRILVGILLACHGAQKVLGAFGGTPAGAPAGIIWTAGPIELVGGALMALGLFSRQAAFLMSGLLAVAYFMAHAPRGFWPILNGGELAIVYSWLSLYLAAQGPGAWALDNLRGARVPEEGLEGVELREHAAH
jgi:putative oxidoreductase